MRWAVGGSGGRYLRVAGIPTYGVQGFFQDRDDVRAHGRDERMLVRSFIRARPSSTSSSKPSRSEFWFFRLPLTGQDGPGSPADLKPELDLTRYSETIRLSDLVGLFLEDI
jgi:hypothetical protein